MAQKRSQPLRKKRNISLVLAFISLLFLIYAQLVDAVHGCCSRHQGVCGCQCCDHTPLSETCRSQMPECGDIPSEKKPPPGNTLKKGTRFHATVHKILDGDTIIVKKKSTENTISIRVADIDCPEKDQPFGTEAGALTRTLTSQKSVLIHVRAIDRYHRTIADVTLPDGRSLAGALLQAGLAWWYRDYSTDKQLAQLEKEAREAKRGLWSQTDPIPPWVFRRRQRRND